MEVIKHISVDLSEKHNVPVIYAVQGDAYLRKIKISFFNNGQSFDINSAYNVFFSYQKSDGHGGMYDRLENGSAAFEQDNAPNVLTVTLAEQVLNVPGFVNSSVSFVKDGQVVSTFPIVIDVSAQPGIDVAESKDYFVLGAAVDAVIAAAQKPVNIVDVYLDDDTSSYVKNYSFADIMDLIDSQSPIVCNWYDPEVILPLVQYRSDVVVVFSCVLDNTEYKVAIYADERVAVSKNVISSGGNGEGGDVSFADAVLYTPQTLTEEQKTQARDNIGACDKDYVDDAIANLDRPTGGEGGHNAFLYEFTLEEDLGVVNLAFPANWEKILQFNIHMEANIPTEMEVTSFTGGAGWAGIGTLPAGSIGLNIYGITFDLAGHNTVICTEVSIKNRSDSALPKFPTKGRLAYKTGNTFALYSETEGAMFPAGTTFYVWGVYAS